MGNFFSKTTVVSILAFLAACSASYDFRSDDRPAYDNTVSPGGLLSLQQQGVTVLDVRLMEDFLTDPVLIPDAKYVDPEDIETWARQMSPADSPVIVYCVRGKWVSQKAANYLAAEGFEVYSLDGGIEGWKLSGRSIYRPD